MEINAFSLDKVDDVAVITFDQPGETVNKFSPAVRDEFFRLLQGVRDDRTVSAVILRSGKPDSFIAGADIDEFVALASQEEARRLCGEGQRMLAQVAAFPKPIVIAISGACLGGGLEFSIAAHYRVASDDAKTRLGLPEVQLGILPATGGCQRLPRLIGLRAALDIILTGRPVGAARALRVGLIDELVPEAELREAALTAAQRLAGGWRPKRRGPEGIAALLLDHNPLGRRLVLRQARKRALRRTGGHYPAPLAALEAVRYGLAHGMDAGLRREAELFGRLVVSEVSRNLVRLFFATRALKKERGAEVASDRVRTIDRLGIVGAGFMGAGIAGVVALKAEIEVRLSDLDDGRVRAGIRRAHKLLDERLERGRLTKDDHARIAGLVTGVVGGSSFADRDLVIEAVFEDLDVKREVIAELERTVPDSCIVASNTSTISISRLQDGARRPERIVGAHFFSPVAKMPLLEVVRGERTADWVTGTTVGFGHRLGKTVIVVRDAPGFWVNRLLAPYLNEAGWLLAEGTAIEAIDSAMTSFGFPVGPITLLDEIGLDVAENAAGVLHAALGERLAPAPAIATLVKEGRLGRKTGRGFFRYKKGRKRGVDAAVYRLIGAREGGGPKLQEVEERLVSSLLNEAARAVSEGVVRQARDGDIGAIFGFGFPAFLGGPLRYIDARGPGAIVERLAGYATRFGERFAPAELLVAMARTNRKFYG